MRWLTAMGAIALLAAVALILWGRTTGGAGEQSSAAMTVPGGLMAEVLNGTGRPGLARAVTHELRTQGIDVVYYGNAPAQVDSTVILVRRGPGQAGLTVRAALPVGLVRNEPDARRYVDVSVVLGADYPLPTSFHP